MGRVRGKIRPIRQYTDLADALAELGPDGVLRLVNMAQKFRIAKQKQQQRTDRGKDRG
jgi:hypothetical protein